MSVPLFSAYEVGVVVCTAGALVFRYLRPGTQRPCAGYSASGVVVVLEFGRDDLIGRSSLLNPGFESGVETMEAISIRRAELAERIWSRAAGTVLHARHHV